MNRKGRIQQLSWALIPNGRRQTLAGPRKIHACRWQYAKKEKNPVRLHFPSNDARRIRQASRFPNEMKFLAVHPSCLMYSKIYLRLEPLGLELVAAAAERAGHSVQLIDLQCETHRDFFESIQRWRPDVIAFSGNYLANVPEIIDLARAAREVLPNAFICVRQRAVISPGSPG